MDDWRWVSIGAAEGLKKYFEGTSDDYRFTLSLIRRSPLTTAGLIIVAVTGVIAIDPFLVITHPLSIKAYTNFGQALLPPSTKYLFGTDDAGRDIFSRVMYGFRIDVGVGLVSVALGNVIGVPLGLASGYLGGRVDDIIMRSTDMFMTIPPILLALAINEALGLGLQNTVIAIGIAFWPYSARIVRSQVIAIKEEGFLEAARAVGAGTRRILFRHVLPNCSSVILIQSSAQIGYAILTIAALGFLGVGAQPPTPEWGLMITVGREYTPASWWYAAFPGLALFVTVLGYTLLGDGLRDIFDPKLRR